MPRLSALWPDYRVKPAYGSVDIDRSHPLSQGLLACWLFNEGAGTNLQDLEGIQRATITDSVNCVWRPSVAGVGLKSSAHAGTTRGVTVAPAYSTGSAGTPFSWDGLLIPLSSGDSYGVVLTENINRGLWYRHALMKLSFYFGGDNLNTTAVTSGTLHHYVVTYNGATLAFYLDGMPDGTFSIANVTFQFDSMFNDTNSETYAGDIIFQRLWNRALTPTEVFEGYAKPYAMLRPLIRRRYFVPAAAPAGVARTPHFLTLGVGT